MTELAATNMNDWWKNWRTVLRKILVILENSLVLHQAYVVFVSFPLFIFVYIRLSVVSL
jgi:hypothetical protein